MVRRRNWSGRTIHGAVYGPGGTLYGGRGPSMALRMVRPDHVRRRGWSGRTIYAAMDGPAGPSTAPWMVPRTMYGAVDGPAGPTVGGTIYGMTDTGIHISRYGILIEIWPWELPGSWRTIKILGYFGGCERTFAPPRPPPLY